MNIKVNSVSAKDARTSLVRHGQICSNWPTFLLRNHLRIKQVFKECLRFIDPYPSACWTFNIRYRMILSQISDILLNLVWWQFLWMRYILRAGNMFDTFQCTFSDTLERWPCICGLYFGYNQIIHQYIQTYKRTYPRTKTHKHTLKHRTTLPRSRPHSVGELVRLMWYRFPGKSTR